MAPLPHDSFSLLLTEEERLLRATVRDFADRELRPRSARWDESEEPALESFRLTAGLGLTGLGIPAEYGGSGGGSRQIAIAVEELARGCASTSLIYLVAVSLFAATIVRFGSEQQKRRYLPSAARGESIGAFAYTEPGAGSDAAGVQATAVRQGNGYVLNGQKIFITNGDIADALAVFATVDRSLRHTGITAFVVDKGTPGLSARRQRGKMGMRGSPTAEVFLDNVRVPEENRLGKEGEGFTYAMQVLETSRIAIAAQAVGIGQAALEDAARYAKQRQQFGRPIAEFQGLRWMLADMATRLEAARLLVWRAAQLKDQGQPVAKEASMAKLFAGEAAMYVTTQAVQVYGGYGYFRESAVERYLRDAKVTEIYEGTSQVQRIVIAREVLRELA